MNKEEIIRRHFHGYTDEKWNEKKNEYPFSEIPYIVDHVLKDSRLVHSEDEKENIQLALLEAIWISRWDCNKTSLYAVLNTDEAYEVVENIYEELKKILFILLLAFTACTSSVESPEPKSPFVSGDIVYLKIDSTKAIIKYELGKFDDSNFAYRINYKDSKGEIKGKFILSSELFKK